MKKTLFIFFTILAVLVSCPAFAEDEQMEILEEVILEAGTSKDECGQVQEHEKTLAEKLRDIYSLEIEQTDMPSYLMEEILTKNYSEKSLIKNTHIWGAYRANWNMIFNEDGGVSNHYAYDAVNLGLDGTFKDDAADFRIMLGVRPLSHKNIAQYMFSDMYVATNKIPHHRVIFGHIRPKVGMEGGNSAYTLPFVNRSQIARNYGTARRVGLRAMGDYRLVDYEIGGYSSDTFFNNFFPGAEFVGWVNFKPLGLTDGKYGELKIGGGIDTGHRDTDFCVAGAYVGYEYKKWMLNFEWANADGYNGGMSGRQSTKHSDGFYATVGYKITPKLQALLRYDEFNPDKKVKHNTTREYVFGLNYFIKGQALRLILNYVFCQNDSSKDSHRIVLGTQILF